METAVPAVEEIWAGLPGSSVFKQKKLTGLQDDAEPSAQTERRMFDVPADHAVLLAAYHVVAQWYLDDLESLIGCCLTTPCGPGVRASYVYSEDEDAVESLLSDVRRQLGGGRVMDLGYSKGWDSRRAPVFFYSMEPEAAGLTGRRVVLTVVAGSAEIAMPPAAAQTVGIDDFQRRVATVAAALAAGECRTVGELKARLGEGGSVPYRQLDEMQRRVVSLWSRVLNVPEESLDATSSYFEVGGTSLNAFKLVNRVRLELQRDISIRDIIENPTIQEFARLLLRD